MKLYIESIESKNKSIFESKINLLEFENNNLKEMLENVMIIK